MGSLSLLSQFRFLPPLFSSFTECICMTSVFFASFCFSCGLNFPWAFYSRIQVFRKPNIFLKRRKRGFSVVSVFLLLVMLSFLKIFLLF